MEKPSNPGLFLTVCVLTVVLFVSVIWKNGDRAIEFSEKIHRKHYH